MAMTGKENQKESSFFLWNTDEWLVPHFKRIFPDLHYSKSVNHFTKPLFEVNSVLIIGIEYIEDFSQFGSFLDVITNQALNKHNLTKIILLSNYAVYEPSSSLLSENLEKAPKTFTGCRAAMIEDFLSYFGERFQLPVVLLRLFNIYGPYQPVPYLIPQILHSIAQNNEVNIGDVEKSRDFLFINDFMDALKLIVKTDFTGLSIFNIGSGNGIKISELIEKLEAICGKKPRVTFDANKIREEFDYDYAVSDISRIREVLNWEPKFSLEEGLALTYSWMLGRSASKCLQPDL